MMVVNMMKRLTDIYSYFVFRRPMLAILAFLVVAAACSTYISDFRLDASADSLLMEGDQELIYSREINSRYGIQESVIVAFTPKVDLFTREAIDTLFSLSERLLSIESVFSVDSILNVPVFMDTPLTGISEDYLTIMNKEIDLAAARMELVSSPVFRDAVVSTDGRTAGVLVTFVADEDGIDLLGQRTRLRALRDEGAASPLKLQELRQVEEKYSAYSIKIGQRQTKSIASIRSVLQDFSDEGQLYLGGAPMIADDLVTFVRGDLSNFSFGVLGFIVLALGFIFRKIRWVLLPLACCAIAGTVMLGVLGFMDWRVTVVSSNFISLLLIITISLTVHLTVRYRELRATRHFSSHDKLLKHAILSMIKPCFYTGITTAVAFGSLLVSGISPIISFGWMMVLGVFAALSVVFGVFPALLKLMPADRTVHKADQRLGLTSALAELTDRWKQGVLWFYGVVLILGVIGLSRLEVENSFIDYFSEKTEIYQGMTLFDRQLGGTLSFDVIVDLPEADDPLDSFNDDFSFGSNVEEDNDGYWFTAPKMDLVERIHSYIDSDQQTGKVLSFGAVIQLARKLNGDQPIDGVLWAILYSRLPETLKSTVLTPFVSIDENQLRFNVRVIESDPLLKRDELLTRIERGIETNFGLPDEAVNVTGILVLYNNVLQSLFESQILTLGTVMLAILFMFIFLFRSIKIAIICIIPNAIAAAFVLGVMGWLSIPLDIMTITIAAISVGIGVDNTIHYMHRFRREFNRIGGYRETMYFCHNSIGRAMYYTSMTIVAGFSILALSNFIPTIVFGLLTSVAMLVALIGSLTLLPQLLITFRPLGPENNG
jgi:hypothetical protein